MTAALAMRAVVHDRYGPPDVLRLEDVERPVAAADEVLVRIHASTRNRQLQRVRQWRASQQSHTAASGGLWRSA